MANKGEWSEPYAAIKILGDGKLYIADENGNRNPGEWMTILELIRHETRERIVSYKYQENNVDIDIFVNGMLILSVPAVEFLHMAEQLAHEIQSGRGSSFNVSNTITDFLHRIEMQHIKAASVNKSDAFFTIRDPRAGIVREHIGFSIKSEFGENPTLFNTAKASGFIYEVSNMDDMLMNQINSMVDARGHAAVLDRCDELIRNGCELKFAGLPIAYRARCKAFEENLDLIDPRLVNVLGKLLWNHFFEHETQVNLSPLMERIIVENPCNITRPEVKYPHMIKSFIYAAYCGMTASTLWDGKAQVNGGFIKVNADGEVLAHYALESDAFKSYLYNNCYLEFPATDEGHGFYANVYKEDDKYYFRLNFQIRYR